jgi:hypothetical protein
MCYVFAMVPNTEQSANSTGKIYKVYSYKAKEQDSILI